MSTYTNYSSSTTHYVWTGLNSLNQFFSKINIDNPMILQQIKLNWGGYGQTAYAYHCLWDYSTGDLIVRSTTVSGPSGRQWLTANVADTYLDAGAYYVGIWCNPSDSRQVTQWNPISGLGSSTLYEQTALNGVENIHNYNTSDGSGIFPAQLIGTDAGRMWANVAGTWQHGQVWINQGGTWTKSKGVWINQGGTWTRSK